MKTRKGNAERVSLHVSPSPKEANKRNNPVEFVICGRAKVWPLHREGNVTVHKVTLYKAQMAHSLPSQLLLCIHNHL